jgi:phosphatidylinositol alpha-1,6-mannosyltransferase
MSSERTLVVTNDFPPRAGGIQAFIHGLILRQPADSVVVYAPSWKRAEAFDAEQPFEVVRHSGSLMLPTPDVAKRAREIARAHGCTRVLFGAAAPLGLLAPRLHRAGIQRFVAVTHGHEAGWAALPGGRKALRTIGDATDTMTFLGEYTRSRIASALTPKAASRMRRLVPGVDEQTFNPGRRAEGATVRASLGLADRRVVVCVSRLMPRKGQDSLIKAWPEIKVQVPDAALLLVGGGPHRKKLDELVRHLDLGRDVVMTGTVPWEQLPAHYAAGDVFAMPCRTRNKGLDVEGLGIVYLEASATGLPVIAGDSGGAPDAVLQGITGEVVPGRSRAALVESVTGLLNDPDRAAKCGQAGRDWVEREWRWDIIAGRLTQMLAGIDPDLPQQSAS